MSQPDNGHPTRDDSGQADDAPLRRLLSNLPQPVSRIIAWLRRPGTHWMRVPTAAVLIGGGALGFLPILGFWMLPIGIFLLAEDIPMLRRPTMRALGAVQRWWDERRRKAGSSQP